MPATDPMSVVAAIYAAFGRGDLPALLDHLQPDVRWRFVGDSAAPYLGERHGHAEVQRWFGEVAAADRIEAFEPREFLPGPDHVTVLGWERTQAMPGGGVFETDWVHVWKLRDGRVASFVGFFDSQAAGRARG